MLQMPSCCQLEEQEAYKGGGAWWPTETYFINDEDSSTQTQLLAPEWQHAS